MGSNDRGGDLFGKRTPRPPCPRCPQGHGDPYIVMMKGHVRTVIYTCDTCLREWDVTDEPKPDKP
jgi:hypothetical protein